MSSQSRPSDVHDQLTASLGEAGAQQPSDSDTRTRASDGTDSEQAANHAGAALLRREGQRQHTGDGRSLLPGMLFGRYVVIGELGAGGMGVVYAAYDPQLDRKIAIKVLTHRKAKSLAATTRLVREARALAKLSHPNVVQVYDVGEQDDHVFIAMEFVDGQSLREFCQSKPPPDWRTVTRVYLEAARGLASAHEKGLIHRDFKPANVLIGRDGRVRVVDFGLVVDRDSLTPQPDQSSPDGAVLGAAEDSAIRSAAQSSAGTSGSRSDRITVVGTLMGTLAYMPPEQHTSADVGPLADQYSFCASLYEGLYGRPPFTRPRQEAGRDTPATLYRRKLDEALWRPDSGNRPVQVPAWLHAVLARGLSADPARRYPSMDALIAALMSDPVARRRERTRRAVVAGTMAAALGVASMGWLHRDSTAVATPCTTAPAMLAGVWDPAVKDKIHQSFLATGVSYAQSSYERLEATLAHYAGDWTRMSTEACEATWVHRRQSEHILDLRTFCLDQRLGRLRALTRLLSQESDAEVVEKAIQAAINLPAVADCANVTALTQVAPLPEEPGERAAIEAAQAHHDEVRSLRDAGKLHAAYERGEVLLQDTAPLTYAPLRAQILYTVSELRIDEGHYDEALVLLREALAIASRAKDDALVLKVWAHLLGTLGYRLARYDEFRQLLPYAEAALERTEDALARADLFTSKGGVLRNLGKLDEALSAQTRALELRTSVQGAESYDVAQSLNEVGLVLKDLDRFDEARAHFERSMAILARLLGEDHLEIAPVLLNLGIVAEKHGRFAEARALNERAIAIRERVLGPDHLHMAQPLNNLAILLRRGGDYPAARAAYERTLAILRKAYQEPHPGTAQVLSNLGTLLSSMAEYKEAHAAFTEALVILVALHGENAPATAVVRSQLALMLAMLGDQREAQVLIKQALEGISKGKDSLKGEVLSRAASVYLQLERADLALAHATAALALNKTVFGEGSYQLASDYLGMARALILLGRPEQARPYVAQALALYTGRFEADNVINAVPVLLLGEIELAAGQPDQALPYFTRAIALSESTGYHVLADGYRLQAEALWALGDKASARTAAERALERYRTSGRIERIRALEAWLRQRR